MFAANVCLVSHKKDEEKTDVGVFCSELDIIFEGQLFSRGREIRFFVKESEGKKDSLKTDCNGDIID